MRGTWTTTSSSPDLPWLIGLGAAAGAGLAVFEVAAAVAWWAIGVTAVVLAAAPVAWLATRGKRARCRAEDLAAITAARRAREQETHQRRLELARAKAPRIQIGIDGGVITAIAARQQYPQPGWQAEPAPVIRREVEK